MQRLVCSSGLAFDAWPCQQRTDGTNISVAAHDRNARQLNSLPLMRPRVKINRDFENLKTLYASARWAIESGIDERKGSAFVQIQKSVRSQR